MASKPFCFSHWAKQIRKLQSILEFEPATCGFGTHLSYLKAMWNIKKCLYMGSNPRFVVAEPFCLSHWAIQNSSIAKNRMYHELSKRFLWMPSEKNFTICEVGYHELFLLPFDLASFQRYDTISSIKENLPEKSKLQVYTKRGLIQIEVW